MHRFLPQAKESHMLNCPDRRILYANQKSECKSKMISFFYRSVVNLQFKKNEQIASIKGNVSVPLYNRSMQSNHNDEDWSEGK